VCRVRREGGGSLTPAAPPAGVVAIAPVAPLLAAPGVRHEQVSQLLLGETATLMATDGEWRHLRNTLDGYEGWTHRGYLRELDAALLNAWSPTGWSEGAELEAEAARVRLPLRALVDLDRGAITLPDGRRARVVSGRVASRAAAVADARAVRPDVWAADHFLGAPYQWGGVTPWGADCSGLVQTTFAARGVAVPRDAHDQAIHGVPVPLDRAAPGDLLFFRGETTDRITHVGFLSEDDTIVHCTISRGGAVRERWASGSAARTRLQPRLVAARRYE
jgi:cell wall-associated NlpC family hydrolase